MTEYMTAPPLNNTSSQTIIKEDIQSKEDVELEIECNINKLELSWGQPKLGLRYSKFNFNC